MRVEIADRQGVLPCPRRAIRAVVREALRCSGSGGAELSVALVADAEMSELNRRFLGREGTTDVLSFPYGTEGGLLGGEVVVNAEAAAREAARRAHSAQEELLLYVAHGVLHLLGCEDGLPAERRHMRRREREVLKRAGFDVES